MKHAASSRRDVLKLAGLATAALAAPEPLVQAQEVSRRGLPPVKITDVKTILTQPGGEHLVIVKVLTRKHPGPSAPSEHPGASGAIHPTASGAIHPNGRPASPAMGNLGDMCSSAMCCQVIGVDGPT